MLYLCYELTGFMREQRACRLSRCRLNLLYKLPDGLHGQSAMHTVDLMMEVHSTESVIVANINVSHEGQNSSSPFYR